MSKTDNLLKIITLGDSGVGKTCLLLRFCQQKFTTSHLTTVGADCYTKSLNVDGERMIVQVWDTSGQERFRTIAPTFIKKAMGVILAYSVDDKDSFEHVEYWMEQIKLHSDSDVSIIIVGTKIDMPNRCIELAEGQRLANSYGVKFFETSSKENINIDEAFLELTKEISEKKGFLAAQKKKQSESVMLRENEKETGKKCCS